MLFPIRAVFASTTDGTVSGYAWSDQIGWINFGTANGDIHITDSGMTGWAWNENMGRINLNPTNGGVDNNSEGTLSGAAWLEGTGWIYFTGVTVNSSGEFSGSTTGDNDIDITFDCTNCNVATDWRPASARDDDNDEVRNVSGGGGGSSTPTETPSEPVVLPDTTPPQISVTTFKNAYASNESVVFGGSTEPGLSIIMFIDDRYGGFAADAEGNWLITLGMLAVGSHAVEFTVKDLAGNTATTGVLQFSVLGQSQTPSEGGYVEPILGQPLPPILQQFAQGINTLLPGFFQPISPIPQEVVTIPQIAPVAFRGDLNYISSARLSAFVLAPLPSGIGNLAQKLPDLRQTFGEVGIETIGDAQRLANIDLKLPNLTETILAQTGISTDKFALPKAISLNGLSETAKNRIPAELVFAKAGAGLIDFNASLTVDNEGKPQQKIETVAGKPLQLVVKADKPVKKVIGYVVFKSKKPSQLNYESPINKSISSLLSGVQVAVGDNQTTNEDAYSQEYESVPRGVETRLILAVFEYEDTGNGIYTAEFDAPVVDGEYEIITVMDYEDGSLPSKEIRLVTVIDPEGYVYEKRGNLQTRISGAIVTLYWLNPNSNQYELWPAKEYQQENPQVTDQRGTYSFLVPNGYYYLKVDAPGYYDYDGKPFEVREGSGVHINVEMKTKFWFIAAIDWKGILLLAVIILLIYNFYRDKIRDGIESRLHHNN